MRFLSKSSFLKGRQCHRRLWLAAKRPPEPPIDPDEVWEMREAEGALVERHAEHLFPGLIRIAPASDDDEERDSRPDLASNIVQTTMALRERRPIAQAHLQAGQLLSITDILEPEGNAWIVWEVKASTSVKPIHIWDLAFQVEVARRSGLAVAGAGVIRLESNYVREGVVDPAGMLARDPLTREVRAIEKPVQDAVGSMLQALDLRAVPAASPSSHCRADPKAKDGNRPSTCGYLGAAGYCGSRLPEHWAGELPRLSAQKWAEIQAMQDPSIEALDPDERVGRRDKWTDDQQRGIRAVKTGQPIVDAVALRTELAALEWPVAYLDFEFDTGMAVPRFDGCSPYDRLPFQWSMHVQARRGDALVTREPFLHLEGTDPRRPFAIALLAAIPSTGSIVAHHAGAEKQVIEQLADRLGGQISDRLRALLPRFFDTEALARAGYYHPAQKGSWSIKKLAPALIGTGYEGLAIQNGLAAVAAWKNACTERDPAARERIRAELLAYCGQDTALMHEIVERLRTLAAGTP